MLAIKLKIIGRRNQRTFRVIVQEARAKLGGKFVEDLGWYNPHTNQFKVNKARVEHWINNGAQPTDSVKTLLKKAQSSEVGSYEAREGRKKKKSSKGEIVAPAAQGESKGEPIAVEASVVESEAKTPPAEEVKEEAPTTEDNQPETDAQEEAPILSQDSPDEQNRGSSISDTEQGSEEVGIEEQKKDE